MEQIHTLVDVFLHLEDHLSAILAAYGSWTYLILSAIIFCETGLVVTPFLPGDSLLFATGAVAANGSLDVRLLFILLSAAAIAGNTSNYWIGSLVGPRVFTDRTRWLKREHLEKTRRFYEKHGGKAIVLSRFMPIIRTFAPFVAGIGKMNYWRFLSYNVVGGTAWVALLLFAGYYFGNLPVVEKNFSLVILAIVVVSLMPAAIEFLRERRRVARKLAS